MQHTRFKINNFFYLLGIAIVNAFFYNESGLDGMSGRHSIWRRWGRYREQGNKNVLFKALFVNSF